MDLEGRGSRLAKEIGNAPGRSTAGEHPTALVESVAMGSIPAPIPSHIANLPERTVAERMLSSSQLETVVYASHALSRMLPGTFKPAERRRADHRS